MRPTALWRKLHGRSAAELRERLEQRMSMTIERLGLRDDGEPTDDALLRRLRPDLVNGGLQGLATAVHDRARPPFFPGVDDPGATARLIRHRWPGRPAEVLRAADQIVDGNFALLGRSEERRVGKECA